MFNRPFKNKEKLAIKRKKPMKKFTLLLVMTMFSFVFPAFAVETEKTTFNAVCVTLKSGDCKYAAFIEHPKIISKDGKLYVLSLDTGKQLVLAECSEVLKITAVHHDFSSTGIKESVVIDGKSVDEIYNIDGTKATNIMSGKIYIIKSNGKTRKVIK